MTHTICFQVPSIRRKFILLIVCLLQVPKPCYQNKLDNLFLMGANSPSISSDSRPKCAHHLPSQIVQLINQVKPRAIVLNLHLARRFLPLHQMWALAVCPHSCLSANPITGANKRNHFSLQTWLCSFFCESSKCTLTPTSSNSHTGARFAGWKARCKTQMSKFNSVNWECDTARQPVLQF